MHVNIFNETSFWINFNQNKCKIGIQKYRYSFIKLQII